MTDIIVALGCNRNSQLSMLKARLMLRGLLGDSLRFTESLWTEPEGMSSGRFLNCLAAAKTTLSQEELTASLKRIERACGNTAELRQRNIIVMDIDLLQYGQIKLHASDWQRGYIKTLIKSLAI